MEEIKLHWQKVLILVNELHDVFLEERYVLITF